MKLINSIKIQLAFYKIQIYTKINKLEKCLPKKALIFFIFLMQHSLGFQIVSNVSVFDWKIIIYFLFLSLHPIHTLKREINNFLLVGYFFVLLFGNSLFYLSSFSLAFESIILYHILFMVLKNHVKTSGMVLVSRQITQVLIFLYFQLTFLKILLVATNESLIEIGDFSIFEFFIKKFKIFFFELSETRCVDSPEIDPPAPVPERSFFQKIVTAPKEFFEKADATLDRGGEVLNSLKNTSETGNSLLQDSKKTVNKLNSTLDTFNNLLDTTNKAIFVGTLQGLRQKVPKGPVYGRLTNFAVNVASFGIVASHMADNNNFFFSTESNAPSKSVQPEITRNSGSLIDKPLTEIQKLDLKNQLEVKTPKIDSINKELLPNQEEPLFEKSGKDSSSKPTFENVEKKVKLPKVGDISKNFLPDEIPEEKTLEKNDIIPKVRDK